MAIMLITHDLGVVAENADVVAVMYASRIVECATVEDLFDKPKHPYTEGLFRSIPKLGAYVDRLDTIRGTVPNPALSRWMQIPSALSEDSRICAKARGSQQGRTKSNGADNHVRMKHFPFSSDARAKNRLHGEIEPHHWAACHQIPQYDSAQLTIAKLDHRREVVPNVVDPTAQLVITGGRQMTQSRPACFLRQSEG